MTVYTGTSKKVEEYLIKHIGEAYHIKDLVNILDLPEDQYGSVAYKLIALTKRGNAERVAGGTYRALPSLLDDPTPQGNSSVQKNKQVNGQDHLPLKPALTPAAHARLELLEKAKDAQPIDLSQMMTQVIAIDEQNKMYRNALEQIVLLLEQAGIITKAE